MTEAPFAFTLPLSNEAKTAIFRAAHRERAQAYAAFGRAIAGGIRRLFTRKPATGIAIRPAGFAR